MRDTLLYFQHRKKYFFSFLLDTIEFLPQYRTECKNHLPGFLKFVCLYCSFIFFYNEASPRMTLRKAAMSSWSLGRLMCWLLVLRCGHQLRMDFLWKQVIAKRAAGCQACVLFSIVNEALSEGLENVCWGL